MNAGSSHLQRILEKRHPELFQGPGTELKKLLAGFGIHPVKSCGCMVWAFLMNKNGAEWSLAHIDEIAAQMAQEANARGWRLPALRFGAKTLVRLAVLKARGRAAPTA